MSLYSLSLFDDFSSVRNLQTGFSEGAVIKTEKGRKINTFVVFIELKRT